MIDIVIPVYRGEADVRRCLASIWASPCATPYEIVVVDDASPEPALSAWLDRLAEGGRIRLLRNARNLGFVGSVNRGMALHAGRDVVLLNSDTEVANDWLDRIARCAASAADIATVTPFSNNATICSYPFDGWSGEVPGTLGLQGLDRLFARQNAGQAVEIPTAVGFCMFIRRASLDALGLFDAERFGRGYGEENDFSLRAAKAGWRNMLCADTFVYHHGGVSFGAEREALMRRAAALLLEVHPDYDERVRAFVRADPARGLRLAMDHARLAMGGAEAEACRLEQRDAPLAARRSARHASGVALAGAHAVHWRAGLPVVLHVSHGWGGGIDRWIADYAAADDAAWHLVLRSRTDRNAAAASLELVDVLAGEAPLLSWELDEPIASTAIAHAGHEHVFRLLVDGLDVRAVVVSSLIGHSLAVFGSGRPTMVMLHDLYPYCPALFGWFGEACRDCGEARLRRCLRTNPLNLFWYEDDGTAWLRLREAYAACLARENVRLVAPSRSVLARYAALFPGLPEAACALIPHGLGVLPEAVPPRAGTAGADRRLRVVVPGRLAPHKGLGLLQPILGRLGGFADVLLLGCGEFGEPFANLPHVEVVRDFKAAGLAAEVARFAPDCALLLSVLPESFSYTLSEMQALGVPVVATALGAVGERIVDGVDGFLVEPRPEGVLQALQDLAQAPARLQAVRRELAVRRPAAAAAAVLRYRELLGLREEGREAGRKAWLALASLRVMMEERGAAASWRARHDECRREREAGAEALRRAEAGAAARIQVLEQHLAQAEAHRDAMLRSTSWRLTAPLRFVVEGIRRLRGRAPAPPAVAADAAVPCAPPAAADAPASSPPPAPPAPPAPRATVREACRARLYLADRARIVLGAGPVSSEGGFAAFARCALRAGELRTGWYFVWCGRREGQWSQADWQEPGIAVALRRLFIVDAAELEDWLAAADAWLSCGTPSVGEAGRACDAGLPPARLAAADGEGGMPRVVPDGGAEADLPDWLDALAARPAD